MTVSGSSVTNKPVRPRTKCSNVSAESGAEQELNGLEEGEDAMTDEEGQGVEGEGEAGTADWRVGAGPRNKTYCKRKGRTRSNTHMPFPDGCAHCMMGRGRTHHHVSRERSEDFSKRPMTAMDYNILKPKFTLNSQTIPEESVTCIAVKGIEEPPTSEIRP